MIRFLAWCLNAIYGYEGLNLLFRILPSGMTIHLLRNYGATVGKNVRILNPLTIHNADRDEPIFKNLTIGDDVFIGRGALFDLASKIQIANRVTISHFCSIHTHTDAGKSNLSNTVIPISQGPVIFDEDAYVGTNVCILQNVEIGRKSVIAAGSLVKNSIPSNSLIAGVPAVIKRNID